MKTLDQKVGEIREWLGPGSVNFFARQFGGKDTHGGRLAAALGVSVISGGEILRNSKIPPDVQEAMHRGELVPPDDYLRIVLPYLGRVALMGKPLVLSAVGRLAGEEEGVLAATEAAGHPIMAVPHIEITREEAFRRLQDTPDRGRADDTPEALRTRLDEFDARTAPVLKTYEKMGLLVTVSGMQEEHLTYAALIHELHGMATCSQAVR